MELTETPSATPALRAALAEGVEDWKRRVHALAHEIHGYKELAF